MQASIAQAGEAAGVRHWECKAEINREMVDQLRWNNAPGWSFTEAEAREVLPDPTPFETFVERHRDELR